MSDFDFSTFPILTTPRLLLREIIPGDAPDLYRFLSDPEGQKYDPGLFTQDLAEAQELVGKIGGRFAARQSIGWGIQLRGENHLVGCLGFSFWERAYYKADLGYTVARTHWRCGIATEAIRALMQFGFETLHLHRINVDTRIDNIASVRLMQKLGFIQEGVRRECVQIEDGTYQSWGLFGMLKNEYRQDYLATASC
jgi:ribosomal-protein-alanine N-acetyltransferase